MENLLEDYLTENIPPDLLHAYERVGSAEDIDSHQHPQTNHSYIGAGADRRSLGWDYGKSTYKVISADEAVRLVKNDKHEVENLRILIDKDLVEYEIRNNGSIYPIYRNRDKQITLNVKGVPQTKRNIGYFSFKTVVQNADKIYWTDEYSHPISDEKKADREAKKTTLAVYDKHRLPGDPDYDPHAPAYNFTNGRINYDASFSPVPDTGSHKSKSTSRNRKSPMFLAYSHVRLALKELEKNKELYDEEEYEAKKQQLTALWKDYKAKYDKECKDLQTAKDHAIQRVWKDAERSNQLLVTYLSQIQSALNDAYEAKRELESMKAAFPRTAVTDVISYDDRIAWEEALKQVEDSQKHLEELRKNMPEDTARAEEEISKAETSKEEAEEIVKKYAASFDKYKEAKMLDYVKKLIEQTDKLKKAQEQVATLRPHETARKAAKKNAQTELDPSLANIIDFVDFVPGN